MLNLEICARQYYKLLMLNTIPTVTGKVADRKFKFQIFVYSNHSSFLTVVLDV